MTRFGEILQLWQNFKSLWAIFGLFILLFGKLLYQLWHFYAAGHIFIAVNGQILNSDIVPSGHTGTTERMNEASTCPMTNI